MKCPQGHDDAELTPAQAMLEDIAERTKMAQSGARYGHRHKAWQYGGNNRPGKVRMYMDLNSIIPFEDLRKKPGAEQARIFTDLRKRYQLSDLAKAWGVAPHIVYDHVRKLKRLGFPTESEVMPVRAPTTAPAEEPKPMLHAQVSPRIPSWEFKLSRRGVQGSVLAEDLMRLAGFLQSDKIYQVVVIVAEEEGEGHEGPSGNAGPQRT